ncbi:MAG: hypothetical protein JSV66_13915 [Trueperaceae bacterium]|nr:MAG: hypothetical protein JSV66_13915 [Trueperaceae bacterium]
MVFALPSSAARLYREFHISGAMRTKYELDESLVSLRGTVLLADLAAAQKLAQSINTVRDAKHFPEVSVKAGDLYAAGLIDEILHLVVARYREQVGPQLFVHADRQLAAELGSEYRETLLKFATAFPTVAVARGELSVEAYLTADVGGESNAVIALEEMLMLWIANQNPALERFQELFDDASLASDSAYTEAIDVLQRFVSEQPELEGSESLFDLLRAPALASPTSLIGQLNFIREKWGALLGADYEVLFERLLTSVDILREEDRPEFGGPGPSALLEVEDLRGPDRGPKEVRRFSPDRSWMPRVVLLAKSTHVWLDQLSRRYQQGIHRLDQIPDEVLDEIARAGFSGLWLIGLWQRSEASRRIKHVRNQTDALASAYALYDYQIADVLGGHPAYLNLRDRAWQRGIRLASDMVPNHVGIDAHWVVEHPDWFVQLAHPPYPSYSFEGPDLCSDQRVGIFLEDHYYDHSDAAVVFKRLDRDTGEARYIYHGNDGTSMPWNDTAQLDYLNAEVREAVIQTILQVARMFPIIRFDAAMTLAKQHIQRLWFPEPGQGGAIPSRAQHGSVSAERFDELLPDEFWREVVDRVAEEVPDTLLLAEAFWMMEGYFVRTLGMHRVYNSAFMNMLKREENQKYRQVIKNVLAFEPQILKRFVNFMNNPDEEPAIAQFGKDDKYFGVCTLMCTMPGLPMFGHGQIEGFEEKYGMEYRRSKLQEAVDEVLLARHRREIFPLLRRRQEFAEVDDFALYDLMTPEGSVNEDVFAYSNRHGDRVSLVLFHNRFAETKGWLKKSVPIKASESEEAVERSLAEGLAISGDAGRYLLLRDHVSGLEYLRSSDEVVERGLYVELGAFKYQVFLDIQELQDSAEDWYRRLCEDLAGEGVPSVDEALTLLRLRPLHLSFKRLVDMEPSSSKVVFQAAYDAFIDHAAVYGPGPFSDESKQRSLTLWRFLDSGKTVEDGLVPVLIAWLVVGSLPRAMEHWSALRLATVFESEVQAEAPSLDASPTRFGLLAGLVLRYAESLAEQEALEKAAFAPLFDDSDVRDYLRVHKAEGTYWFSREAYRLLIRTLLAVVRLVWRSDNRDPSPLRDLEHSLFEVELESGYELEALLELLTGTDTVETGELDSSEQ